MASFDGSGDLGILRSGRRPDARVPRRTVPCHRSLLGGGAVVLLALAAAGIGDVSTRDNDQEPVMARSIAEPVLGFL